MEGVKEFRYWYRIFNIAVHGSMEEEIRDIFLLCFDSCMSVAFVSSFRRPVGQNLQHSTAPVCTS